MAFAAEIVAPGQHAQREAMQHVLAGEADGAEHLMRDGRAFGGGFAGADFCRGGFEKHRVAVDAVVRNGVGGRTGGGQRSGCLAGEAREVLLHRLEFADLALERDALVGVSDGHRQHRLQRAGNLQAAHGRAHQHERRLIEAGGRCCAAHDLRALERHRIRTVTSEIFTLGHAAIGDFHQSNNRTFAGRCNDSKVFGIFGERNACERFRSRCRRRSTSRGHAGGQEQPSSRRPALRCRLAPAASRRAAISASGAGNA